MPIHALKASFLPKAVIGLGLAFAASEAPAGEPKILVDSHDVLLMDVSSSMDLPEIQSSFRGVASHYLSDEAMMNYRAGICTAATVVYFGGTAAIQDTAILCSEESVRKFIAVNMDENRLGSLRNIANSASTDILPPLKAAVKIFRDEDHAINVEAVQKRVVIAGDEMHGDINEIRYYSNILTSEFGATVSGVAIGSVSVQEEYRSAFVTPPKAQQIPTETNKLSRPRSIAPGLATMAISAEDAGRQFQVILAIGGF